MKSCGGVTSPFPHSILRFNLTDNVRVRTYPHGPCRPKPLPVPAARLFPNIFSLPDDDRRGKKVGNDFGRDQNTHINALIVLVSTRLSSSGPGHHHRDDKLRGWTLRWGSQLHSQLPPPRGRALDWGNTCPPQGGTKKKKEAAENCTPHKTSFPGGNPAILQTVQTVYKPFYKPCTVPREFLQTVQTVTIWGVGK